MIRYNTLAFLSITIASISYGQEGSIEAEKISADSLIGDGSRITGIQKQNLAVSISGDTLFITEGNWVLIPGLSSSNSGNAFANAGVDIVNACQTSFNLNAAALAQSQTGLWTIESGTGGNLVNATHPNAQFIGQEGESYVLKWTVMEQGGSSSFDLLNVSIAINTETSVANAGQDLFAIMTQTITLNGSAPEMGSNGMWEIQDGIGGILANMADPMSEFTGVSGESYTLQWRHFNDCSTSTDEVVLTFSSSASGVPSANGRYFIPDPKFRQYLQIAYPSVMDGDSLIVAIGDQVDKVRITNLDVANLDGLQYLTALKAMNANNNGNLQVIPFFSDSLTKFSCQDCHSLEIIPAFPISLDTLEGWSWQMSSIPSFPPGLRYIRLSSLVFISELPILPANLKHLDLSSFPVLTSIPTLPESCAFVSLSSLGPNCCPTEFSDTLNIPSAAKEFRMESIGSLFPTLPVDKTNIEQLFIENANIASMPSLYDLINLDILSLSNNALFQLDSVPFALQHIQVEGNPLICVKNKPPLVADQLSQYDICPGN